jgi:hypothetical protein
MKGMKWTPRREFALFALATLICLIALGVTISEDIYNRVYVLHKGSKLTATLLAGNHFSLVVASALFLFAWIRVWRSMVKPVAKQHPS